MNEQFIVKKEGNRIRVFDTKDGKYITKDCPSMRIAQQIADDFNTMSKGDLSPILSPFPPQKTSLPPLTDAERTETIEKLVKIAMNELPGVSEEQVRKRVNKVIEGKFLQGMSGNGPQSAMEQLFIQKKIDQIMSTQID